MSDIELRMRRTWQCTLSSLINLGFGSHSGKTSSSLVHLNLIPLILMEFSN